MQTDKTGFADALLRWHETHARDLPWRGEADPYRIWLSEIMLQQTRTETVKRYYEAFLRAFPTVFDLANAEPEKVLKLWEGMGYYSRARNLHAAAKLVAREMNGEFPKTAETLRALPGVGAYAAGAIASIAYGERVPALDGNQARVLARVLHITSEIRTPQALHEQAIDVLIRILPAVLMHSIGMLAECERCYAIILRHYDIPRMAEIDQRKIDCIRTSSDNSDFAVVR